MKIVDLPIEEFTHLFNSILINVTSFFRDPPAWQYLTQEIVPRIVENNKQPDGAIRVWSAGCASGQEAYTIAMIVVEALGTQEFLRRVRIYATDVDQDALEKARRATYTPRELQGVPKEFQDRYFTHTDGSRVFRGDLRKAVISPASFPSIFFRRNMNQTSIAPAMSGRSLIQWSITENSGFWADVSGFDGRFSPSNCRG